MWKECQETPDRLPASFSSCVQDTTIYRKQTSQKSTEQTHKKDKRIRGERWDWGQPSITALGLFLSFYNEKVQVHFLCKCLCSPSLPPRRVSAQSQQTCLIMSNAASHDGTHQTPKTGCAVHVGQTIRIHCLGRFLSTYLWLFKSYSEPPESNGSWFYLLNPLPPPLFQSPVSQSFWCSCYYFAAQRPSGTPLLSRASSAGPLHQHLFLEWTHLFVDFPST